MTLQSRLPVVRSFAWACALTVMAAASPSRAVDLSAIPIPAALRPSLAAACQAWGRHIEDLIEQHRAAGDLAEEDLEKAVSQSYAAKAYCSMGCLLESLATYEKIPLERVKQRSAW